jgi:hypothetical protein
MVATRDLRVFRDCEDPFFNFTAEIDVFALYSFCKTRDLSFSRAVLFYSMMTANEIREVRIRMMSGKLVEFDRIEATQTILNDDETFSFAYYDEKRRIRIRSSGQGGDRKMQGSKDLRRRNRSARSDLFFSDTVGFVHEF